MTKACLDFDYLEVEEGHAKGCSEPREGLWGSQSGLEDKGIEEFLAVARAPLGTAGPGPGASGFQGRCLQHTKEAWPVLSPAPPDWQESRGISSRV